MKTIVTILKESEFYFDSAWKKFQKRMVKKGVIVTLKKKPSTYNHKGRELDAVQCEFNFREFAIHYKSYKYIGTLKKSSDTDKENLIFSVDKSQSLAKYFKKSFRCDHCNTNRFRLKVHIFRHKKNPKKELMVATSCGKEYFGEFAVSQIRTLTRAFEAFMQFIDTSKETYLSGTLKNRAAFNTKGYAKIAYGIVRRDGKFVSQQQTDYMGYGLGQTTHSTRESVDVLFENRLTVQGRKEKMAEINKLSKDFNYKDIVSYWEKKVKKDKSDFTMNVYGSFRQLQPKKGMICYGVYEYLKNVKNLFGNDKVKFNNKYLGEVGSKITKEATVIRISGCEGRSFSYYGPSSYDVVNLVTKDGYALTWFTSTNHGLKQWEKVTISGTVKKFNDYKGKKSTLIKNCKVD